MNKEKIKMSIKTLEDYERKYGMWFGYFRPYYYFFNKEKGKVIIYNKDKEDSETYTLDELKKKIKEIFKKNNLETYKEPSTEILSRAVSKGLDLNKSKEMIREDAGSVLMFYLSGASSDIEKKLNEEEKKIYYAIPPDKHADFLELTKEKNYKNLLSSLEDNELKDPV